MSERDSVKIEDKDGVRLITLNRPEVLNSMNTPLWDELAAAFTEASVRSDISVVVLTGEGKAFTAGTDLGEMGNPPVYTDGKRHGFEPAMDVIDGFPKPLIAAVNGLGVGIGLTILPHCDLVLIAEDARLRVPFVSLGVTAEAGSTYLLPKTIGWQETAHLLYTSSWMVAEKAVETGLAWKIFPRDELMGEVMALANQIAAQPLSSLMATKHLLVQSKIAGVRAARAREVPVFASLSGGPANREAVAAFREKREPDFRNLDKS